MDAKTRKVFSWTISVLIHSVLAFFIIRAGVRYLLPEGEVTSTSGGATIEFEAAKGTEAGDQQTPEASKSKPAPQTDEAEESKADKDVVKYMKKAEKEAPPKFMPDKSVPDAKPVNDTVTEDDNQERAVVPPPADEKETETAQATPEEKPTPDSASASASASASEETNTPPVAEQQDVAETKSQNAEVPPPVNQGVPQGVGNAPSTSSATGGQPGPGPQGYMDINKLKEKPGNPVPRYPWKARMHRQNGMVLLHAFITPDGHVESAAVIKSSGIPEMDTNALEAYKKYQYFPGPSGWVIKQFNFILKSE